jgi:deferrochelatase/peroxidase EfeB
VFLFLEFGDAELAREWVRQLTPSGDSGDAGPPGTITMTAEVTDFKEKLRKGRVKVGKKDPEAEYITAVWTNVSFTFPGIEKLQPELAEHLESLERFEAFRQGAARREIFDQEGESNPGRWVLTGGVDALLTIAADDPDELAQAVTEQVERAARCGVTVRYQQRGDALPGSMHGREHFGFKDGVSQPGIGDYSRPAGSGSDEDADHPGSKIVPREHFLFAPDDDKLGWMADGSFQAFVRFTQDVGKWSTQSATGPRTYLCLT